MTTNKTGNHLEDNIGQRVQDASDRLVEIKDDVTNNIGKRIDSLGALMKDHPLAAVGIALGIGYLLARILHR